MIAKPYDIIKRDLVNKLMYFYLKPYLLLNQYYTNWEAYLFHQSTCNSIQFNEKVLFQPFGNLWN